MASQTNPGGCTENHSWARSGIHRCPARRTLPCHPRRGSPIEITDPQAPQRAEQQLRGTGTYIDFTWALVLNELPGQRTRLLVHTRANYSPRALRFLTLPLGLFDATYGVAQLRAIARRAENPQPAGP